MTYKAFQQIQAILDGNGVLSNIIRLGEKSYEVVINFNCVKKFKQRRSAKQYIIKTYKHLIENETKN